MLHVTGHEPKPPGGPPRKPVEPPPTRPDPQGVPDPTPIDDPRPPQPGKIMRGVWSLLDDAPPRAGFDR